MSLAEIKTALRQGEWAWPGGYPQYFVTSDGAALSFKAARQMWREVVGAHLTDDTRGGWHIAAVQINWEDADLFCDHTGERIQSAYGEDE